MPELAKVEPIENLPEVKRGQTLQEWYKSAAVLTRIAEANVVGTHNAKAIAGMVALAVHRDEKLQQCSPWSVLQATLSCVSLGLLPDGVSGQAYLVPFKTTCTLIVGYRGMIQLSLRSGMVKEWRIPQIVWEGDDFHHHLGDNETIIHNPCGKREKMVGVYVIVELTTGGRVRASLTKKEVMAAKAKSRGSDRPSSPWNTNEAEMWKKTVVRRVCKYLPSCTALQQAITIDEAAETATVEQFPGQLKKTMAQIEAELTAEPPKLDPDNVDPEKVETDPPSEESFLD